MERSDEDEIRFALSVHDARALEHRSRGPATESRRRDANPSGVGVLDRSVAVLAAVEAGARSLGEIQRVTHLARSTTHRIVSALEDHGFLLHVGGLGYALGPRLLGLAANAMRQLPLRDLAHPALERLARTTGESAQLYVRDRDQRICVDSVESSAELRTIVGVGAALPIAKGSAGKIFLAWDSTDDARRVIDATADPDRLHRQVIIARRRGWADSFGEREAGVASVSAPVLGPGDTLLAVVSVSGPRQRLAPARAKQYAPAVMEAAREIERAAGFV